MVFRCTATLRDNCHRIPIASTRICIHARTYNRPEEKSAPTPQSSGLHVLTTRVDALLSNLQREIETADEKLQGKLRLLDLDGDGRISREELLSALGLMQVRALRHIEGRVVLSRKKDRT